MKSGFSLTAICCSCWLAIQVVPVWAYSDAAFQQARNEFRLANDDTQLEKSAANFKRQLQQDPAHPLLMAYSGAATSKLAVTTMLPWKKLSYAEEGLAQIDKALLLLSKEKAEFSTEIEVKYVAAYTFLAVPEFMNRNTKGQQLLQEIANHTGLANIEVNLRAAIWLKAAQQAIAQKQHQQARHYLNQILPLATPQVQQAQTLLKGLPS